MAIKKLMVRGGGTGTLDKYRGFVGNIKEGKLKGVYPFLWKRLVQGETGTADKCGGWVEKIKGKDKGVCPHLRGVARLGVVARDLEDVATVFVLN